MADEGFQPIGQVVPPTAPAVAGGTEAGGFQPIGKVEAPGMLSRLWQGMLGQDVSKVGRVGMGMGDPIVGGMQLGARVRPPGMGEGAFAGLGMQKPAALERMAPTTPDTGLLTPAGADTLAREREGSYQQREKSAGLSGGLGSEWARLLGNVASPVNVAGGAAMGAAARGAPLAGRLGASALTGAGAALTEPQTGRNSFDIGEIAKRAGFGAVGGAVGGAAGEAAGSALSRAIASNSPQAVDQMVNRVYRQVVKPGRRGVDSSAALGQQDNRILTAVDQIIANRPSLQLTDEAGNPMVGQLPRSLRQFGEAADQIKGKLFQEYDSLAQTAGTQGAMVDLAPVAGKLQKLATDLALVHPTMANEAAQMAQRFLQQGTYSPSKTQDAIQQLNKVNAYPMRSPLHDLVTRELRDELDKTISQAVGPGYQALRSQYGALRSVEKDVSAAVQREANKIPGGAGGMLLDTMGSEEIMRGIITLHPGAVATGLGMKAIKQLQQYVNGPNRAIARLFQARAAPSAGVVRSAIGDAAQTGLPIAGAVGGGATAGRELRPTVAGP
jgi:hypothetical protein